MVKHILFVCATGIATSTEVAEKVINFCHEQGIKITHQQINVASVPGHDGTADLIISTTNIPYDTKTPVIKGLPLITGIGEEKVYSQIADILKD